MLEVQSFLRSLSNLNLAPVECLKRLNEELGVKHTIHERDPLVILNYCMIASPKRHTIIRECRALTLELGTWNVVARAFPRFFNAGECPDLDSKFDWFSAIATGKEDGSLITLFRYCDQWRVNTRGSFALGEICPDVKKTWEEVFFSCIDEVGLDTFEEDYRELANSHTFVFELCSPWNKIVRRYEAPKPFLLTAFHNQTGVECNETVLQTVRDYLLCDSPDVYNFSNLKDIEKFLEEHEDPTFEGLVLRDRHGMRLKVKNARYVALHHLHGNGNIFMTKNLLPLVLKNEQAEVLAHFPEAAPRVFDVVESIYGPYGRMNSVWEVAKGMKSQKEFAIFVNKHTGLAAVLFEARKSGAEPRDVFLKSEDLLLKRCFA